MAPTQMPPSRTGAYILAQFLGVLTANRSQAVLFWDRTSAEESHLSQGYTPGDSPHPVTSPGEVMKAQSSQPKVQQVYRAIPAPEPPRRVAKGGFATASQLSFSLCPACFFHSFTRGFPQEHFLINFLQAEFSSSESASWGWHLHS